MSYLGVLRTCDNLFSAEYRSKVASGAKLLSKGRQRKAGIRERLRSTQSSECLDVDRGCIP